MRRTLLLLCLLAFAREASAVNAQFTPVGDFPGGLFFSKVQDVSADGTFATGTSTSAPHFDFEAFRWSQAGGLEPLGSLDDWPHVSFGWGIVPDGSVITGTSGDETHGVLTDDATDANFGEMFRWTPELGIEGLGFLIDEIPYSRGRDLAADGETVVGFSLLNAIVWTEPTGIVALPKLPGGFIAQAFGTDFDGDKIVGWSDRIGGYNATLWAASNGSYLVQDLGALVAGGDSVAKDISDVGDIVVGWSDSASGKRAFLWRDGVGLRDLGTLPGDTWSEAIAVSPDGSRVVGTSGGGSNGKRAFIWDANNEAAGPQDIKALLAASLIVLPDWQLVEATGLADDGDPAVATVVGWGENPNGDTEGWLAKVILTPGEGGAPETIDWLSGSAGSGATHSCGVLANGSPACWGSNSDGQLNVPAGITARKVVTGNAHSCALTFTDDLVCWGRNVESQAPAMLAGPILDVAAGSLHTCVVFGGTGAVSCFGFPGDGRLDPPEPPAIPEALVATAVTAGDAHSCALSVSREVLCWGANSAGQTDAPPGIFEQVDAGFDHTCGKTGDELVECWGSNAGGKRSPPGSVTSVEMVTAGGGHSCSIGKDGVAQCWGSDANGEVSDTPTVQVTQIDAGGAHTCARALSGDLLCWGSNASGQLDVPALLLPNVAAGGDATCQTDPSGFLACFGDATSFANLSGSQFFQISQGMASGCGVNTFGTVDCWGADTNGVANPDGGGFSQVSVGGTVACAINSGSQLQCWGSDANGTELPPAGQVTHVSLGVGHGCAVKTDGDVTCWGDNSRGQAPALVAGPFETVSAGDEHTCAKGADARVSCWGADDVGQLSGATPGLVESVESGSFHSCAVLTSGSLVCWGEGGDGQTAVPAGSFASVAPGGRGQSGGHTCMVADSGAILCIGLNDEGQATTFEDGDGDGVSDVLDNCATVPNPAGPMGQPDADGDDVGDACDICPSFPDPFQLDNDGDFIGNACDACPLLNTFDGDPETDDRDPALCETSLLFTVAVVGSPRSPSAPPPPLPGDAAFEVRLRCGSNDIESTTLGLVMEGGLTAEDINFGGDQMMFDGVTKFGCSGLTGFGLTHENFCNGASTDPVNGPEIFGVTVERGLSYVLGPDNLGPNANLNTLYFNMIGVQNLQGDRRLCMANDPNGIVPNEVLLARVEVHDVTSLELAPPFTEIGLNEILTGLPPQESFVGEDTSGGAVDPAEVELQSGSDNPIAVLSIKPSPTAANEWAIGLESEERIAIARFAITGFPGVTMSELRYMGCHIPQGPVQRNCVWDGSIPWTTLSVDDVDPVFSKTLGPSSLIPGSDPTLRSDTLYVEVGGKHLDTGSLGRVLNPDADGTGGTAWLGTIRYEVPGEVPDPLDPVPLSQPTLWLVGVETIFGGAAFLSNDNAPFDAVDGQSASFFLRAEDTDGDGFTNDFDNCAFKFQQLNERDDDGGVESASNILGARPDGDGNVCQCGDTTLDGRVVSALSAQGASQPELADSPLIEDKIVGKDIGTDSEELGSVEGPTTIGVRDFMVLELQGEGRGPGVGPNCPPARPPGL